MKIFSIVMKTLNWLVAVTTGFFACLWMANRVDLDWFAELAYKANESGPSVRFFGIVIAVWLVLFNLFYLFGRLFVRKYASHVTLRIDSGNFSIALSAIEHSLRRVVKKLPDIHDVHVRIYKNKAKSDKPMRIYTTYTAWEGTNLKDVTEKIQSAIKMRFKEIVETKEEPVFEVVLSNIVEKDRRKLDSKRRGKEPADKRMFYGPEYPID
ncbi:MAG: alkaline shock response membrane anchor protein AmaP [Planctomycetes bacterium]|nr:alkaline shock response membrane anchor protein AmaP [Planctomycetota bacterium]